MIKLKRDHLPLLALLAPAALLLPFLGQFPFTSQSQYTDLAITHYPNAVFLLRSLREFHQLPLWSSTILSGYPFAANPLSGIWYPFYWLCLLFPLPFGFNLLSLIHLLFGGFGMYAFLRAEKLDRGPALVGGLAFEALPRLIAHFASGHLLLVFAICWTPWLLLAAARNGCPKTNQKPSYWEAAIFGLILLADVRWAAYSGLLWFGYRLAMVAGAKDNSNEAYREAIFDVLRQAILSLLIAAPLLLPLMEYIRLSTRQGMSAESILSLSLPPARLFGLLFPSLDGNTEWTVYPGALLTLSLLWSLANTQISRRNRYWLGVVIVSLILSLGSNFPGMTFITNLPGFSLLRVPPRFVLLAGIAMVVLAAKLAQTLCCEQLLKQKEAFWSRLLIAGTIGATMVVMVGAWMTSGVFPGNFAWSAAAFALAGLLLLLRDQGKIDSSRWTIAIFCLALVDQAGIATLATRFEPASAVFSEGSQAADFLRQQPGIFRVYSPSYSLPQQTAARAGLELVNGIDPMQLASYSGFVYQASGMTYAGYDVVLPPLEPIQECCSQRHFRTDPQLLGLLNARYIVSDFDMVFKETARFGATRVYENEEVKPRAWVQPDDTAGPLQPVTQISIRPNDIDLKAEGPGLLVLSEIYYPGWQVSVDGARGNLIPAEGVLRGVRLAPGIHTVHFAFRPVPVFLGIALALAAWLSLGVYAWRQRRR